ncbi:MAG TPA: hypothetical protein VHL57_05940, partial [Flavobacteriales bacterium]|nr:hypothetical protein [Flavobacteriales bacterium]
MDRITMVIGLGMGLALFSACKKETTAPAPDAAPAVQRGHSKAPHAPLYAIYTVSRYATGLALFDPDNRVMIPLGRIVDAETREDVDHFTGITWDPIYRCLWLVTNKNVSNDQFRGMLWRIDGEMPTGPVDEIRAQRVAPLMIRQGERVPVMDAYDIEFF